MVMKFSCFVVVFLITSTAEAQFRSDPFAHYVFPQQYFGSPQKTAIPGLLSDPVQNYKLTAPIMLGASNFNSRIQNQFWAGTVTSMSFNKGKFGTYYYWDVQGNLRGTRGFIDISGKNKRGFKLVFPLRVFR